MTTSILRALPLAIVVTENVKREIELDATTGRSERQQLSRLVGDGLVRIAQLEGKTLETFFDLVSGSAAQSLRDGESATLAFAYGHSCSAAIDEKKATRIAAARFSSLRLATTVDILAHPDVGAALGDDKLAGAVFGALTEAHAGTRAPIRLGGKSDRKRAHRGLPQSSAARSAQASTKRRHNLKVTSQDRKTRLV
ncbi:hypothetical protein [Bradyrhizobium sp. LMG 9283]|uniref:hypothetical protein n=1 Tax=Bradyrhizobium sp. LMG 9283 TaxID=592064 RepID=UPI00388D54AA